MTPAFWIAIGLAGVAFCVFTGWPLYNTYKARGKEVADVAEGEAYLKARARAERAQAATGPAKKARPRAQDTGQPAQSHPAAPPSRDSTR